MIDSYTEGLIKKSDFDPKMMLLKVNLERVQQQIDASKQQRAGQVKPFPASNRLEECAAAVNDRLSHLDFNNQLEIIRALVKRIEIYHDEIVVVLRVDPDPDIGADDDDDADESDRSAETSSMQDCKRGTLPDGGRHDDMAHAGLEQRLRARFDARNKVNLVRYADSLSPAGPRRSWPMRSDPWCSSSSRSGAWSCPKRKPESCTSTTGSISSASTCVVITENRSSRLPNPVSGRSRRSYGAS
jgi:hypothetical protein